MKKPERRVFIVAQLTLRLSALLSTLIAISIMLTASQTVTIFTFRFKAHYSYSSAFRFLMGADAVVCASSALSLVSLLLLRRSELHLHHTNLTNKYFFLLLHDTAMLVLMAAGCAASTAIGYVGRHGEAKMMWQPVCHQVSRFCRTMFAGSLFSYLALFAYLALTLVSARRLITTIPSATTPDLTTTSISDI